MIKNIKIKHFGVFNDFYNPDLEFKKFNLFFGWNYSGKTTISKIFACFDTKKVPMHYKSIDFQLIGENQNYDISDLSKLRTKVFNQEYIDSNLSFEEQNATNVILLTEGAENIKQQLKRLNTECNKISDTIKEYQSVYKKNQDSISGTYTDIARNISLQLNLGRSF